jgi:hypothetical protein
MKLYALLADRAVTDRSTGTVSMLNAGWTMTTLRPAPSQDPSGPQLPPVTVPCAVVVFYELEPRYCNRPMELLLELLTEDGQPVELPGPAGLQPVRIRQAVTVASPGGVPPGTPGAGHFTAELFSGLPLAPGAYVWRATLAGQHEEPWEARFNVLPLPVARPPVFGAQPQVQ